MKKKMVAQMVLGSAGGMAKRDPMKPPVTKKQSGQKKANKLRIAGLFSKTRRKRAMLKPKVG